VELIDIQVELYPFTKKEVERGLGRIHKFGNLEHLSMYREMVKPPKRNIWRLSEETFPFLFSPSIFK